MVKNGKNERPKRAKQPKAVVHADYLSLLGKAANNRSRRKALVDIASKNEMCAIDECVRNILAGNVALTDTQLTKLRRHKNAMRDFLQKKHLPISQQKKHLTQSGGFLGALIPIALSALGPLLGGIFSGGRK